MFDSADREPDISTQDETGSVVRRYHLGWTTGHFDEAVSLLTPDLVVEVPINAYPTKASFVEALVGFAGLVTSVQLLCQLSRGDEAMLLYDLDVERLGEMRVAEHFTVQDGRIRRIRQVHDTVAVRAAGLGPSS